jgi:hypothetical protein
MIGISHGARYVLCMSQLRGSVDRRGLCVRDQVPVIHATARFPHRFICQPWSRRLAMSLGGLVCATLIQTAYADNLRGFSMLDRHYVIGADRVCVPLLVSDGVATGVPSCHSGAVDELAKLDLEPGSLATGAGKLSGSISGSTLSVRDSDSTIVTWKAPETLGKVISITRNKYSDRVAVTYTVRRLGREMTDVVGFDLLQGKKVPIKEPVVVEPKDPVAPRAASSPLSAATAKLLVTARASKGKKATAAWAAVVAAEPSLAEGHFGAAKAAATNKDRDLAISQLTMLQRLATDDGNEWLVAARFDPGFASLRGDATFRNVVGFDRKSSSAYERAMGFGGAWEQTGTSCDSPTVALSLTRERNFALSVRTNCEGMVTTSKFKGTWALAADHVVLTLPNKGKPPDIVTCAFVAKGDEEAMQCPLDDDLVLTVLPARR